MSKNIKQGYYDSLKQFNKIEGDKYGQCLKQVLDLKQGVFLEYRIHKKTKVLHIINIYAEGKGYAIFKQE